MPLKHMFESKALKVVGEDSANVYISGWANRMLSDGVGEIVDIETLDLSRFEKNNPLLFNHDTSYVVGRAPVQKKPEGLWLERAPISKSGHSDISYVRDLVLEKMLCGLSVGFSGGDYTRHPDNPKIMLIKNASLHEVSIVAVPMQEDSLFTVSKAFCDKFRKCKSLKEARTMTMKLKGMNVAAIVSASMDSLDDAARAEAVSKFLEVTKLTQEDFDKIISGETLEISKEILGALSTVLGINSEEIKAANEKDVADSVEPKTADDTEPAMTKTAEEIQACVVGKVPELIASGMSKEEAVATAVASCSQEKGCAPSDLTDSDWMSFHKACVVTSTKADMGTGDNVHVLLLQQIVNTLGSIATKMDLICQKMTELQSQETVEIEPVKAVEVEQDTAAQAKALVVEARELHARLKSFTE